MKGFRSGAVIVRIRKIGGVNEAFIIKFTTSVTFDETVFLVSAFFKETSFKSILIRCIEFAFVQLHGAVVGNRPVTIISCFGSGVDKSGVIPFRTRGGCDAGADFRYKFSRFRAVSGDLNTILSGRQ